MTTVNEIIKKIEEFAPPNLAENWDPIGLAFGSSKQEVNKMMVALDLDQNTLNEAKEKDIDFIFTHHPPIFNSLTSLNEEDVRRLEYIELIRSNISLYAAHTNIDAAKNGMNDWLAGALNLQKPYEIMDVAYQSTYKLLVLYTPKANANEVRQALHTIGLGEVGDYKDVSYTSEGTGHFIPGENAHPNIGRPNQAEEVIEERMEILVPSSLIGETIWTIYEVHPYEEPVFHLIDIDKDDQKFGMGRVGKLKEPMNLDELIQFVKDSFSLTNVRVANTDSNPVINKVAILGGSGEKYYKQALDQQADIYITGDISYHGAQDMIRDGLPFIDVGHYVEQIFIDKMTEILSGWNNSEHWNIEVIPTTSQKDVFKFN